MEELSRISDLFSIEAIEEAEAHTRQLDLMLAAHKKNHIEAMRGEGEAAREFEAQQSQMEDDEVDTLLKELASARAKFIRTHTEHCMALPFQSSEEPCAPYEECMAYLQQGPSLNVTEFGSWFAANSSASDTWITNMKEGGTLLLLGILHNAPEEVIKMLLSMWPDGVKEKCKIDAEDMHYNLSPNVNHQRWFGATAGDTPLLLGMKRNVPIGVIRLLVEACPEEIATVDRTGNNALHLGMQHNAPIEVIHLLISSIYSLWYHYGNIFEEENENGKTPLDYGAGGVPAEILAAHRDEMSPAKLCESFLMEGPTLNVPEFAAWFDANKAGWGTAAVKPAAINPYHPHWEHAWQKKREANLADHAKKKERWFHLVRVGLMKKVPCEVIQMLVDAWPECVKEWDEEGWTLLHRGMENKAPIDVIRILSRAWPEGVQMKEGMSDWYRTQRSPRQQRLMAHPFFELRIHSNGYTPLHIGFMKNASLAVIKVMLETWPEGITARGDDGYTLLHLGVEHNAPLETIQFLIEMWPGGVEVKGNDGYTPLQLGVEHNAPADVIQLLLEVWPKAAKMKNEDGCTMLQIGMEFGAPVEVIQLLVDRWPGGLHQKDGDGQTPLHFGLKHNAPVGVIKVLLEAWPESAREKDTNGEIMLNLAILNDARIEVIQLLLAVWPESVKERDSNGKTPLRLGLLCKASHQVIRLLLDACPEAAIVQWSGMNRYNNAEGNLLHFGLRQNAPVDVIRPIVAAWPLGVKVKDANGNTPLHSGLRRAASPEVIQLLVRAWPAGVKVKTVDEKARAAQTPYYRFFEEEGLDIVPLVLAIQNNAPVGVILVLLEAWPESAKEKDTNGKIVLNLAILNNARAEIIQLLLAVWPESVKERDRNGKTPLHLAMQGAHSPMVSGGRGAPASVIKLLIDAWPEGIKATNQDGQTPLDIAHNAPAASLALLRLHLLLPTMSMAQHSTSSTGTFDALQLWGAWEAAAGSDGADLSALQGATDSHFNLIETGQGAGSNSTAATAATATAAISWYRKLLTNHCLKQRPVYTTPLSERLAPVKNLLALCLQNELQLATPTLYTTCDFRPYQQAYLNPAIDLIAATLEVLQANVSTNIDAYQSLLASLSKDDRRIYDSCFEKTVNVDLGGDRAAYTTMLQQCAALKSGCIFVQVDKQPTPDLIPLVLMVREQIPAFMAIVEVVVAKAAAAITSSTATLTTVYRPGNKTKSPYRMMEKALTKGPNRNYPDCSQILDVFGCIIDCRDYTAMTAVVNAFADLHKSGAVSITRVKDRWSTPSAGGWRDLLLNIVVNGTVIFEVQVVLHAMLVARTVLDAHTAYNQFRSFAEVFGMLEIEVVAAASAEIGGGGGGAVGADNSGSAAATRILALDATIVRLVDEKTAADAKLEATIAELAACKATAEAQVRAAEAEREALEVMVAELQGELAARD